MQLLVRRYGFGLFLSIVATMIAWMVVGLVSLLATQRPIFDTGEWRSVEAALGAALIAQVVAIFLRRLR